MKQRVKLSKTELIEKKPEKSKSDNTPSAIELAICIVGIYVCFLTWGITQERVTTTSYDGQKFNFFLILINFQAYAAALVALIFLFVTNKKLDSLDNGSFEFAKLTLLHTVAPHFGYAALKHIDYPTMILGKSCKLVPVMIMNFLLHGKRFPM